MSIAKLSSSSKILNQPSFQQSDVLNEKLDKRVREIFLKRAPTKIESRKIYQLFKKVDTLEDAIGILESREIRGDKYIYANLLLKKAPWENILSLYSHIPTEERTILSIDAFIKSAGDTHHLSSATAVFKQAKSLKTILPATYNSYITALIRNEKNDKAIQLAQEAKSQHLASDRTYALLLTAAGKNKNFALAERTFFDSKRLKKADSVIYNIYIDILIAKGDIKSAIHYFKEGKLRYRHERSYTNKPDLYDFHGLSHGAGIVSLYLIAMNCKQNHPKAKFVNPFLCICGQGNTHKGNRIKENYLTFRRDLIEYIKKAFPNAQCKLDHLNPGCFLISHLPCVGLNI